MHCLLFLGDLHELGFKPLEPRRALLCLASLRRLVAELLDERLEALHLLDLLGALLLQPLDAFGALTQVGGVVSLVKVDLLVVDLGHAVDHVVHERAVVADDDDGARIAAKEAFKPLHALQVQMVRRLVKQQHFGVSDQQLRERDAHLPAARELARHAAHVVFLKAQAEQHAAHLRLDDVATQPLELVASAARGGKVALGGVFPERLFERAKALLGGEHLDLGGHDLVEDGLLVHLDRFLLEVAHARALREQDATLISVFLAGDNVEHGRFAGTVRADERQAVVFLKFEGDVAEQHAAAE